MIINGFVKIFIEQLENEVGGFEYDEEFDCFDDFLRLESIDNQGVILEIDLTLESMSIYMEFGYDAYPNDLRESGDISRIEEESRIYYGQVNFEKHLSDFDYPIDTWEEENYGCLCQTVCVGIRDVPCKIDLIKRFIEHINGFCFSDLSFDNEFKDIREKRLNKITSQGKRNPRVLIMENNNIDYHILNKNDALIYSGLEYVLISQKGKIAAILKCDLDYVHEIIGYVEFFQDYSIELNNHVTVRSCSYSFSIPIVSCTEASKTELLSFNSDLIKLLIFLGKDEKDLLSKSLLEYGQTQVNDSLFFPHIYTEGQTDCLHMKHALSLSPKYQNQPWIFDENQKDYQKGEQELLKECGIFAKEKDPPYARIMIFDRDGSIPLKDIEDDKFGYKKWGNRVYSMALPIPIHRKKTPQICIEHYYSDEEIKREFDINGVKKRLFIGSEFDSIGRAPHINRICRNINKCGKNKNSIIDDNVFDSTSSSEIDYALSKKTYADLMCSEKTLERETLDAFELLFEKIRKILSDNNE